MSGLEMDRYKRRMKAYKTQTGKGYVDRMQKQLDKSFEKTPSFFAVEINGVPTGVHVVEGLEGDNFLLTRPHETIAVGDIVLWEGAYYLCTFIRNNNTIQTKATIVRCNETLKWKAYDGTIHETPCLLEDKTSVYSDGLSKTKYLSLGTDQISILVQTNEDTNKLPIDKRFIFSNDPNNIYRTNRKDNILNRGLTLFVAKKSLYDKNTDDLGLNLAGDVRNAVDDEDIKTDEGTVNEGKKIRGKNRLTIWDEATEYDIDTTQEVVWELEPNDILKIVKTNENTCYVKAVGTSKIGRSKLIATIKEPDGDMIFTKDIELFYQ